MSTGKGLRGRYRNSIGIFAPRSYKLIEKLIALMEYPEQTGENINAKIVELSSAKVMHLE